MTEPGGGSDLQAIRTRAVRDGDEYVVSGSKTFITNGLLADLVVLAVKTDPTEGAAGISLLVAEVGEDVPGFRRGRVLHKIGLQGNDTAELFFDEMRVPAANLLGPVEGRGFYQMMEQLPQERLVIGVSAVAAMERAMDLTVALHEGADRLRQDPVRAAEHPLHAGRVRGDGPDRARVLIDDCITRHVAHGLDVATAAMAKFWLTDCQCTVIDRCLQLFGGYGYTTGVPDRPDVRRRPGAEDLRGANEIMKELVARSL